MYVCSCVHPSAWNNSASTGRIFMKLDIWVFFENLSRIFKFYQNVRRITGNLHEDWHIFLIISGSVLLTMRNISYKSCRGNQSTHFMFNNFLSRSRCLGCNVGKNSVEPDRPQRAIWRMCIACWIPKAANRHLAYVILIDFSLQQLLHKRTSLLHYT